jgi:plasmid stability protein
MSRAKMIQVRNVPPEIHKRLKVRAASQGRSLSDYLNEELRRIAERPTMAELQERIRSRGSVELPVPAAEIIRQEREERDSRW